MLQQMQYYKMINDTQKQCQICCKIEQNKKFYSIGNCQHKFCYDCCHAHIEAKLDSFSEIRCLETKCNRKLTKQNKIFEMLPTEKIKKIQRNQSLMLIQKNKNYKPCQKQGCYGYIIIKTIKNKKVQKTKPQSKQVYCSQCCSEHCPTCFQLSHLGYQCKQANQQNEEGMMLDLNYRRCPNCQIWVQKKGGCQYLNCKCGCQFCYKCGVQFQYDPCRKITNGRIVDDQVRQQLFKIRLTKPSSILQKVLYPLKLLLIFFAITSIILLLSLPCIILLVLLLAIAVFFISPGFFIVVYSQMPIPKGLIILLRISTILLYPLVGIMISISFIIVILSYPLMRFMVASRIFDWIDEKVGQICIIILRIFRTLLQL